jgi:gamma-glutamylcyclotransferase (GGCT)/AIG2-like uncharacterized protein YtfP
LERQIGRTLVFVYGTLMRGERNAVRLAGAAFAGEAVTVPGFELVDLGRYPALVAGGSIAVRGEAYEVTVEQLAALDEFEEVPELYQRKRIPLADGRVAEAWLMPSEKIQTSQRIAHGDWRAWRQRKVVTRGP